MNKINKIMGIYGGNSYENGGTRFRARGTLVLKGINFSLYPTNPSLQLFTHRNFPLNQSNRADGGVALSKFSIRLCPRFSNFFSIV